MTNTSSVPVTVDGVRLDTLAWNIENLTGRLGAAQRRGENRILPGRHGRLHKKYKRYDQNTLVYSMWVAGCDEDGDIPVDSSAYKEFRKNLDALNDLFSPGHRLLDVRQTWPDGDRQVLAELGQAYDPTVLGISPTAKFSVELIVPGAFWQDTADSDYASAVDLSSQNVTLDLNTFAGSTAPIDDGIYCIEGPCNNPRLTDPATGHYIQLNQVLAVGSSWRFNSGTWSSRVGVGLTVASADTAGTNAVEDTVYVGPHTPRYMSLIPRGVLSPQIKYTATGGTTAATQVNVRARRKYLS